MAIPDDGTLQRLQIAEDTYGDLVHDWVDEGMPADILGKTRSMEEFRERQANGRRRCRQHRTAAPAVSAAERAGRRRDRPGR